MLMLFRRVFTLSIGLVSLLAFSSALAIELSQLSFSPAPQLAAKSYLLIDAESRMVIASKNADKAHAPASLTKLMTAYLLEQEITRGHINLEDKIYISPKAWRAVGSRMFVDVDSKVPVIDLLKGIIIQSGNDASVAVAEAIGGSEAGFAQMMNQQAQKLGMQNTQFKNATGLPEEGHYTTANDLALLARAVIYGFPEFYKMYSEKYFTYNKIKQANRNSLLWRDKSVDGLKTGHTEEAGYNLVASAKRQNMRLISIVLGTKNEKERAQMSQKLLDYGFRYFDSYELYQPNTQFHEAEIWFGEENKVILGINKAMEITLPKGSQSSVQIHIKTPKRLYAPITKDQVLGEVVIKLKNQIIATKPLVAFTTIKEAGFIKKNWHKIRLFIASFWNASDKQ